MKKRLLTGEHLELDNGIDVVSLWFQKQTNSFCMMLNSKVIAATKTWKPIQDRLNKIDNLKENSNV